MRIAFLVMILAIGAPALAAPRVAGQWILATDRWGNPEYSTLTLQADHGAVTGDWDGIPVTGTVRGTSLILDARSGEGAHYRFAARLTEDRLAGEADFPDTNHPDLRAEHHLSGRRVPDRPPGGPHLYTLIPTSFANSFSAERAPVLTIWPGDTVRTSTIDSGGMDGQGITRALFGNPQTGPFFIAGARPGDTIAIHIRKLTLNRDWADSLDMIVGRALGGSLVAEAAALGRPVRWHLDREAGYATPEQPTTGLQGYRAPLRPMLGGVALAPGFGAPALSTGDTGRTGGNMDFPEAIAGNTVYLPVQQPGGLLYLGDAHARQGDGETSQYALETSMDVEFSVDLIRGSPVTQPRVESPTELMVLGQAGSIDEALKAASTGLIQWLRHDYHLSLAEAAQVLGTAVRFSVPNLAGRSVGVAARIDKALLQMGADRSGPPSGQTCQPGIIGGC